MERFTSSIRKAISDQNWFAALFLALALPDICGAIESPPTGKKGEVGERYKNWFNRYLKLKYDPKNSYEVVCSIRPEVVARMSKEEIEYLSASVTEGSLNFSAVDCYKFRCKCLHQGLPERSNEERFVFTIPPPNGTVVHRCLIKGIYQLQINIFCEDICLAVEQWVKDYAVDSDIIRRINELIKISHL